jgi:hypothetical protein
MMDPQKARHSGYDEHSVDVDDHGIGRRFKFGGGDNLRWQRRVAAIPAMIFGAFAGARMLACSISLALAVVCGIAAMSAAARRHLLSEGRES